MAEIPKEKRAGRKNGKLARIVVFAAIVPVLTASGFLLWRYLNT